jgi:acyl-CoA thioesterase I
MMVTRRTATVGVIAAILVAAASSGAAVLAQAPSKPITVVAYGDSLSAGYQLRPGDSFPAQLEKVLRARGHAVTVVNAGASGDTTASGLERLAWAVPPEADAVIVEFGANDMLRGLDPAKARANLDQMLATIKAQKQDLLLAGMRAPTSLPADYRTAFDAIFPDLATKYDALLYPFFLEKVALQPKLNLGDGIHPNADGVALIVADILPKVEALLARVAARRAGKVGG